MTRGEVRLQCTTGVFTQSTPRKLRLKRSAFLPSAMYSTSCQANE